MLEILVHALFMAYSVIACARHLMALNFVIGNLPEHLPYMCCAMTQMRQLLEKVLSIEARRSNNIQEVDQDNDTDIHFANVTYNQHYQTCYKAETAVEDELQKRLSQLDNVTTANRLFSFTTSQCSTASEICTLLSPKEKSLGGSHSVASVQVREDGDCQRKIRKIPISRPKQWTEQRVNGGKLGLRACTPTRKPTALTNSASSRKKSCSNLNQQRSSGDSNSILVSRDDSAPTWHTNSFDSQISSSQFAWLSLPDGVRSSCSLYNCKNEDHTRIGVPSLPYAPSSIHYTTSSLPVSSMTSAANSLGSSVGITFEGGDAQVGILLGASMNGDNLYAVGIDAV